MTNNTELPLYKVVATYKGYQAHMSHQRAKNAADAIETVKTYYAQPVHKDAVWRAELVEE